MEYIIENDQLRVTITLWGAQIKSVVHKSDGVEHMWCGNPDVWKYHSPVLFPYCGKVKNGRIEIRDRVVENAPQHGFARTTNHKLISHSADSLTLSLDASSETWEIFPYHFRLFSTFHLEGDTLHHTLTVENADTEVFSFGIGYHPAFAIPFDSKHKPEDYELRFSHMESPICMDTPAGLLNGQYYRLGTNINSIPVTCGMFDQDSHCMINLRSNTLGIYEKDSGRAVVCDIAEFPYCLIWSKPGLPQFLCIEPWHSLPSSESDSNAWAEKAAAAILAPGQCWSTSMRTTFTR